MQSYLKVKIKSLAEEASIIRTEERRVRKQCRWAQEHQSDTLASLQGEYSGLRHHRVRVVRPEARAAQLAYAYLRGKPYRAIEKQGSSPPPIEQVKRLVARYGAGIPQPKPLDGWFKG